jgi:uncharacterized protein
MFRRRDSGNELTVFFATDLHGSDLCFKKFVNAAKFYGAKVLILGGDVTGKMVVPIARQADGGYLTSFAGKDVRLGGEDDVVRFGRRIADMGFYPRTMGEAEFQELKASAEKQAELFRALTARRLEEWIEFARPRLAAEGVKCFAAPGNDDDFFVDEILGESDVVELLEGRIIQLDGLDMLTSGWSPRTS